MITVKVHRDVDIDNVAVDQRSVVGNAVTHAVVDRRAHGLGKPAVV